MRKFVVSDLHGDINTYNAIMGYLENVSKYDEVILYINGDLIDRGIFFAEMLIDIKNRIENGNPFKIEYLAGNHEWMMLDAYHIMNDDYIYYNDRRRRTCNRLHYSSLTEHLLNTYWGYIGLDTYYCLEDNFFDNKEKKFDYKAEEDLYKFIGNLKLYHKFNETLNGKPIVLSHASCPKNPLDICDLNLESVVEDVMIYAEKMSRFDKKNSVTEKEKEYYDILCASRINRITMQKDSNINLGNENYFTIVGHTPVDNNLGHLYYEKDNVLNIDGGNAFYWRGDFKYDHVPLVEIDGINNRLIILTFNHNNEIIYGTYFDSKIIYMNNSELENYRKYLNKDAKIMKYEKEWFE